MKPSSLAAGLKAAAGHSTPESQLNTEVQDKRSVPASGRTSSKTVLIGGHFHPEVRRTLLLIQAESQNEGKNLKQLLGEAINLLCVQYGKPQVFSETRDR